MNRTLLLIVKLLLSVGLLAYLLHSVDLSDVLQHFIEGRHDLFAVAAFVYCVVVVLSTIRWKVLLDAAGSNKTTFGMLINSYMVASFFGNFLPSNVGGDVVRVRDSAKAAGSKTAALTVAFLDRVVGFVALYFIAMPAYLLGGTAVRGLAGARVILLGLTVLFLILGGIFAKSGLVTKVVELVGVKRFPWIHSRFESVQSTVNAYRSRKGAVMKAFALSLVLQFLGVYYFYLIARALHIPLDLGTSLLMVPLCSLIQAIPISFNGWGVREGVYVLYFKQVGLPRESALAFSIVAAGLVVLLSISGLVVWLVRKSHEHDHTPVETA
ncbi:MAG: lysylphosphatidylglycerol synthase transmembrane domain-containing protein [Vicinamibacteria bacterium]